MATEFQEVAGSARRAVRGPAVLTAEAAAREALSQLEAREVVRVPRLAYRVLAAWAGLLPRVVVRRVVGRLNRPAKPGREGRPQGSAR